MQSCARTSHINDSHNIITYSSTAADALHPSSGGQPIRGGDVYIAIADNTIVIVCNRTTSSLDGFSMIFVLPRKVINIIIHKST